LVRCGTLVETVDRGHPLDIVLAGPVIVLRLYEVEP
jgi:hypothetical protein